ncbi:MAG: ATP-binding protein, partial [Pseudomonadota bacterium]
MTDLFGDPVPGDGSDGSGKGRKGATPKAGGKNSGGQGVSGAQGDSGARHDSGSSGKTGVTGEAKGLGADGKTNGSYTAKDIEVLEGLEPVRRRPGMYVGGTDERALHHLAAEILDNAMDEVVAGHASWIDVSLEADGTVTIRDNGRGIPVDEHPKFPGRSVLDVILTTLHSGGKFGGGAYATSGGLHGVGVSVVNALSERMIVEVARERKLWRRQFARGEPVGELESAGAAPNRRGTTVSFIPDPTIFGPKAAFRAERLYKMARAKAYLSKGVEIRWQCDPSHLADQGEAPDGSSAGPSAVPS